MDHMGERERERGRLQRKIKTSMDILFSESSNGMISLLNEMWYIDCIICFCLKKDRSQVGHRQDPTIGFNKGCLNKEQRKNKCQTWKLWGLCLTPFHCSACLLDGVSVSLVMLFVLFDSDLRFHVETHEWNCRLRSRAASTHSASEATTMKFWQK